MDPRLACTLVKIVVRLNSKESLHARLVSIGDEDGVAQAQFLALGLLAHQVRGMCLETLDLSGSGDFEALLCAGMSFHLRHNEVILKTGRKSNAFPQILFR